MTTINKTALITGATDGIGFETAKMFAKNGHDIILHGRSSKKIEDVKNFLLEINPNLYIQTFEADFTIFNEVADMAKSIIEKIGRLDILINNAGVFVLNSGETTNSNNIDIRFCVNTIAPYILTNKLLPIMNSSSRVVNLVSAAQAPIDFEALKGTTLLSDDEAYAQSKLALIMWSIEMAEDENVAPSIIAVNPKSFLDSKMVKMAYGRKGFDLNIGADILYKASISKEFDNANGKYYDNDIEMFSRAHPFSANKEYRRELMNFLTQFL